MEKIDFRKAPESERLALRKTAIKMIEACQKKKDVAAIVGVRPTTISSWVKRHNTGGLNALTANKSGPKSEKSKLLNSVQEAEVQAMIIDKMPDQMKLPFALWTRKAVKELIKEKLGIDIAITTMGAYLRSWGFSPKKQAYERSDTKVKAWLEEEYPKIKAQAKNEN